MHIAHIVEQSSAKRWVAGATPAMQQPIPLFALLLYKFDLPLERLHAN